MERAVIYLQQRVSESLECFINNSENYIQDVKQNYKIVDIIIDSYRDNSNLYNFVNDPPNDFDLLILDITLEDQFDQMLISELARARNFAINYIKRE